MRETPFLVFPLFLIAADPLRVGGGVQGRRMPIALATARRAALDAPPASWILVR